MIRLLRRIGKFVVSFVSLNWAIANRIGLNSPVVVDVKQHVRTAVAAIEEDPRSQGWMRTGSA